MQILFLTRKFAPQNYIGAVRPTKFAKYLIRIFSCKVDIICMQDDSGIIDPIGTKDIRDINSIHTLRPCKLTTAIRKKYDSKASKMKTEGLNSNFSYSETPQKTNNKLSPIGWLKKFIRGLFHLISLYESYNYGIRSVKYLKKEDKKYDTFFSTTSLIESYIVGKWLKKHTPDIRWIYDLRDPLRINSYSGISRHIMKYVLKRTVKLVDEVTGVSQACIQEFIDFGHTSTHIIFNGFDPEDIQEFRVNHESSKVEDKFIIVYTGALYDGKRDISPLLSLLLDLHRDQTVDLGKIEFHYAGKDYHVLKNAMNITGCPLKVINHGFIPRDESIRLQLSADVLLLLSWNNRDDTGVVTGKFYEYLMMKRPIWCIIKGNQPMSLLREMITETGAGICYEEADESTHNIMKEFIRTTYKNKFCAKPTNFDFKSVNRYDYHNLVGEIYSLCSKN